MSKKNKLVTFETVNDLMLFKWGDGLESYINLKILREKCPCANCEGEKDVFGNDKYEYVISNEVINKLGLEVDASLKTFVEQRKKQGVKGKYLSDFLNMKIKPVRM